MQYDSCRRCHSMAQPPAQVARSLHHGELYRCHAPLIRVSVSPMSEGESMRIIQGACSAMRMLRHGVHYWMVLTAASRRPSAQPALAASEKIDRPSRALSQYRNRYMFVESRLPQIRQSMLPLLPAITSSSFSSFDQ